MNKSEDESYFDGRLIELIGWEIIGFLITSLTFGICYPWAICNIYKWEARHTVVEGKRMVFNGTASELFILWIKWWFFCVITFGIYKLWINIDLKKWRVKHTSFVD